MFICLVADIVRFKSVIVTIKKKEFALNKHNSVSEQVLSAKRSVPVAEWFVLQTSDLAV